MRQVGRSVGLWTSFPIPSWGASVDPRLCNVSLELPSFPPLRTGLRLLVTIPCGRLFHSPGAGCGFYNSIHPGYAILFFAKQKTQTKKSIYLTFSGGFRSKHFKSSNIQTLLSFAQSNFLQGLSVKVSHSFLIPPIQDLPGSPFLFHTKYKILLIPYFQMMAAVPRCYWSCGAFSLRTLSFSYFSFQSRVGEGGQFLRLSLEVNFPSFWPSCISRSNILLFPLLISQFIISYLYRVFIA